MDLGLSDVQQREMIRVILHCSANVRPSHPLCILPSLVLMSTGSLFLTVQEKLYNPYYTLVLAQLLQLHSHRFTLQYSLWDFFREMGEGDVGGTEVVRAFKEGSSKGSKGSNISKRHVRNWAKVFGWSVAKDGTTLSILKPINFTRLKPQSTNFLQQFIIALIFASQTQSPLFILPSTRLKDLDAQPLKEAIMKVVALQSLCEGLLYFLSTAMTDDGAWLGSLGEGERQVAVWGREVLKDELMMVLEGRAEQDIGEEDDDF